MTAAAMLMLCMTCQSPSTDRILAEQLARSGRTVEALAMFERIVAEHPTDTGVRLWIALLYLRTGRTAEAEAGFRAVVVEQPAHVDARIGLASALIRSDAWREALEILLDTEPIAGENADLFVTLARAYRRAGDDRRALEYYRRALALAPANPDVVDAYEATLRAYGSSLMVEGFADGAASDARSLSLTASIRVLLRLEMEGRVRTQQRDGSSDTLIGGGAIWRLNRSTILELHGVGGGGNTSLANSDMMAEVRHYRGAAEIAANVRHLSFTDVDVTGVSPVLAWYTGDRWRFAARYTYTQSSFRLSGESVGDHSFLLRETLRAWRRVDTTLTYAYGIESFEDLTADRVTNLGANTVAATVQFRLPSLTSVATTWERQWRSDDSRLDRLTVVISQGFR